MGMTSEAVASAALVVVGPGAIGCLLASFLSEAGHPVTLLDKTADRAAALALSGVRLDTDRTSRHRHVQTTADPACVRQAAWVLLCVKADATEAVLERMAPFLGPATGVASFQNGVDHVALLRRYVGARRALYTVTAQGATWLAPGHITHAGRGMTSVAACDARYPVLAQRLVAILAGAGLEARYEEDGLRMLWRKLILNVGINPVTALSGLPNGALLEDPALFDHACRASCEAHAVACAAGIVPDIPDVAEALRRLCTSTAANLSSMLQDIRRGRPTEINALNGVVVREGQHHGISVPVNAALVEAVRRQGEKETTRARGEPE